MTNRGMSWLRTKLKRWAVAFISHAGSWYLRVPLASAIAIFFSRQLATFEVASR